MKRVIVSLMILMFILAGCQTVDLNAPMPDYDPGIDPNQWVSIPAGEFKYGQHADPVTTDAYEIMVTDVTVQQYADFLNQALKSGAISLDGKTPKGHYPGDPFNEYKHEEEILEGDYIYLDLEDPSQRIKLSEGVFSAQPGYELHPMTMVTWFGAWGYCQFENGRLPTNHEWEKAARGDTERPFPWGDDILQGNANYYNSKDPYENMASFGSRTTPVGFYNGKTYGDFATLDSASPYGLYDMAGNVWQWTGDITTGMHYRFMRGGSKESYTVDLRMWVLNNATPHYASPSVGFRCARDG